MLARLVCLSYCLRCVLLLLSLEAMAESLIGFVDIDCVKHE